MSIVDQRKKDEEKDVMIFDMHELTKNFDTEGKESQPYVNYICAVLNLYLAICVGGNLANALKF